VLQRQALASEIIRNLGPVTDPKEWSKSRTGDVRPPYAEIATLANAKRLRDVKGTTTNDISTAKDAREGEKDIKPGLNFVAKLTGKGETGFVDGQGVFRGPHLPVSLDGPLPQVAVMLGPAAFQQGKDGALGTLRHEMKHAEHFQLMIDWLVKWRQDSKKNGAAPKLDDAAARTRFDAWIDSHKGVGKVERALLLGERSSNHANTELLAYVEGFINIFHLRQDPPTLRVGFEYPPALYQLRRAGVEFLKADGDVKTAALDRLRDYIKSVLTVTERAALRAWLTFLADNAREQAKNAPSDEVPAAKVLHNDFKPLAGFLKQLLALVP
jgi:hypothetical protein